MFINKKIYLLPLLLEWQALIIKSSQTKRALGAGNSVHIPSSFLRLSIFLAGRMRKVHEIGQVMHSVGRLGISTIY